MKIIKQLSLKNSNIFRNKYRNYENIKIIAGSAGSGKSTELYKKALKYCEKGYKVIYFDTEGSLISKLFNSYMGDKNTEVKKLIPETLSIISNIYSPDELLKVFNSFKNESKLIIMIDNANLIYRNTNIEDLFKSLYNSNLKSYMTLQLNREGNFSHAYN